MTPTEALARIAALCDRNAEVWRDDSQANLIEVAEVRAVLAEVTPEPGGTLDRDQAWAVLEPWMQDATELGVQQTLARLEACVRPVAGSVTLGPDEVRTARDALVLAQVTPRHPRFDALRARLEQAS